MARRPDFKVGTVADAMRKAHGIRSVAADMLGCHPSTVTRYIDKHVTLQRLDAELNERLLDTAENVVVESMTDIDPKLRLSAAKFVLSTKGSKKRGWSAKQEVEVIIPDADKADVAFESVSLEELEANAKRKEEAAAAAAQVH